MRVQRVVLEDHRDVAVLGIGVGDVALADADAPGVDGSSPATIRSDVDLAASGRPDQDQELAVADGQVQAIQRWPVGPRVTPGRLLETHRCHGYRPPIPGDGDAADERALRDGVDETSGSRISIDAAISTGQRETYCPCIHTRPRVRVAMLLR